MNIDFFKNISYVLRPSNVIPNAYCRTIMDIESVLAQEIQALVIDVDQTIVPYGDSDIYADIKECISHLSAKYKCCLLSNFPHTAAKVDRIQSLQDQLNIPAIFSRKKKPDREPFLMAMHHLGTSPASTAMIGDRVFTDVVGGNYASMFTVLVDPIKPETDPFLMVKVPRLIERCYLRLCQITLMGKK
jgi:hypothetical protein